MEALFQGFLSLTWQQAVMIGIGLTLVWLAVAKEYEPSLLLPMGFGTVLVNIPMTAALTQAMDGTVVPGAISVLFDAGIANEMFPLLIFIGIGAMMDFSPVMERPVYALFGLTAQAGIFLTMGLAYYVFGFSVREAASIGIIGAADGPTSIFVSSRFAPQLLGPISVAAYSYMSMVPVIQPPVVRALTTKEERRMNMTLRAGRTVSKRARILFPIVVTIVVGIFAPSSSTLIGFLMFGNLLRECGVLNSLSDAAQNVLSNLITLILGITITAHMTAAEFLRVDTLLILGLGLLAFVFDTVGGVLFAKIMNLFVKNKVNPMIGAAGISAFPMSARIIQKMGQQEDPQNFLLMHAVGANVSGQIASVIAGGIILNMIH